MEQKEPMTLALMPEQAEEMRAWDDYLIQAARDATMEPPDNDEILEALRDESYQNLKALAKDKGVHLKDLAKSMGLTPRQLHDGVRAGEQFPRTPGAFDAMCRQLGFEPSEARRYLGGIYEAKARGERIDTRMSINEKLRGMHAVYQKIVDPAKRSTAEFVIDTLWRQLNDLADSQS